MPDIQPHHCPRRILVAVTGLSPQVVTETLYALAVAQQPAFIPTEIHIITTVPGAERARLALLSDQPGWLQRLLRDYQLPPIQFDIQHIHVLRDAQGQPLQDIRTPEENELVANSITDHIRRLTQDPHSAIHASIAGGRKTLGFYLGYALSLYGRPQDRLSHVLVPPAYETNWEFFYPPPASRVIITQDNALADAAEGEVRLAEIPFVSLRHGLPSALLNGDTSYSASVQAARQTLGPPELILDLPGRRLTAAGVSLRLPPSLLAFHTWFAQRRRQSLPPLPCPVDGVTEHDHAQAFLRIYRSITGPWGAEERTAARLQQGMDKAFFQETKSKLHRQLKAALGEHPATPYQIHGDDQRPTRFGLTLPAHCIQIHGLPDSGGDREAQAPTT